MKNQGVLSAVFILFCVVFGQAGPARAIDYGDVVYGRDMQGDLRAELVFEHFDREVEYDIEHSAEYNGNVYAMDVDPEETNGMDQGLYLLRVTLPLDKTVSIYFDGGMIDEDDAGSSAWMLGIGGRINLYDRNKLRLNLVGSLHWAPTYEVETDVHWNNYHATIEGDKTYTEMGVGILASTVIQSGSGLRLVPYGGLVLSALRGESDYSETVYGVTFKKQDDFQEEEIPVAVAGLSFLFDRKISLRVEGRFIGDSSISAGFGMSF